MATTSNTYTGNGSNRLFSITFPYLNTTDIDVYLNGTLQTVTTQYTFANATTVEFVTAPSNGATVLLKRSTDDTALAATFFAGSSIRAADLNDNFDQVLYLAQETNNNVANAVAGQIPDGTITNAKLAVDSVASSNIIDGAIVNADVNASAGITAGKLSFTQAGTGATARTIDSKLKDVVSVKDFGAIGNGVANDSAAIQAAIDTGKKVYIPSGTYLCNVVITNKTIIEGDGSTATILTPFSVTTAALTYTSIGNYWSYHSEIKGIGFTGAGTKTGVGFTFGKTDPTLKATNDEYANNVRFIGCKFTNLEKGVQFSFGNIGTEFYSCGFQNNKYGVYCLDNKFGGDAMHAGCKYFYSGEFSGNECGFYLHDNTEGFGGVSFTDTIFEYNLVAAYIRAPKCFVPIKWTGVWFEGNGQLSTGAATVTIDAWTGSTRSNQTLTKRTVILDGSDGNYQFNESFFTDIYVKGTQVTVKATNCRIEPDPGNTGYPCTVDVPTSSSIYIDSPNTNQGFYTTDGIITAGRPFQISSTINSVTSYSTFRWFITQPRGAKIASYGPAKVVSAPLTTAATTGLGTFNLTGTVVSDGRIYSQCNEFTRAAFASTEFTQLNSPNSSITTVEGWYVFTLDAKRTAGNPRIFVWDRNTAQFVINATMPALNKWYTIAGLGYSAGGQTLYLDFSGGAVTETCTWRISAYQMLRFDTLEQAQSFLASGTFIES